MKTTITQNQIFETFSRLQRSCCSAVFLLLFLLSASSSWGQVTNLQAFTNLYNGTSNSQNLTYAVSTGSNSYRLLVVAVTTTLQTAASNRTIALTYGGRSLTLATGDLTSNTQQHTAIYYLNEAGLDLASNTTLAFTATNGTTRVNMVWAAVYDYVNQTTPLNSSQNYNSGTGTTNSFQFGTALSLATGNQGVLLICSHRTSNTSTRNITYPTNWTLDDVQTYTTGDAIRSGVAERTIPTTTTTDNCATTFSGNTLASMTGIAINGCTQPSVNAGSALAAICIGGTSAGLGGTVGGSATGGTWSADVVGGTFSPNATTLNATYTPPSNYTGAVTLTLTTSGGSCGVATASKSLFVGPRPSGVSASTSALTTICANTSINLSSSATSNSNTATTLLNENFNGTATGWTTTNTSTGGTPANSDWKLRPNGYNYSSTIFNSNDTSQFYFCNSDEQGTGSNTNTTLRSPSFSTNGLSAASLSFYQYFRSFSGTSAIVEISTNGTTWAVLATYAADEGSSTAFVQRSINLSSYLNQANVSIRFRFNGGWGWYWAIDNVTVTSTPVTPAISYAWTSSPAGFTSTSQNPTASPSANITYTVTATNNYGCSATANTSSVTVRPVFTSGTISSTGQTICSGGTPTEIGSTTASSGGDDAITYSWRSSADSYAAAISGATSSTYTPPAGLTATTSYRRYANDGTCTTTPSVSTNTWTVTVIDVPATPDAITGTTTQCPGLTSQTYSISAVTNATTYNWTVPTGWSITAGSGTRTITVNTGASGQNGDVTVTATNSCGTSSARTLAVTVSATNTVGIASSTPTLCINTALTAITHTTTGATGSGTPSGLPGGVTAAWASNTITISGTPTAAGTFNYTIPLTGGCGTVNATGTIIVTPAMTAGTASITPILCINTALTSITHTTTLATGIGTATNLPTGVTASWVSNTITLSGTPTQAGTFNYSIPLTGGCGTVNATGTITVNSIPTVTNASICAGGSGSLTVTSSCADLTNQTSGPRDATSGTNVIGVGSVAWVNPGNIAGAGNAGMQIGTSATTNYLRGTGYGFAIPSNATINGITLSIRKSSSGTTAPYLRDSEVKLVKGGVILAANKAATTTDWSNNNVLATTTYGGAADLWNTTWTPAEINASNFGAVLAATNASTGNNRTAAVDWMQITVTFTLPGVLEWYTATSGGTSIGTGSTFNPVGVSGSGLANTNTAGTTSYYVACSTAAGACRAKADFTILPAPNPPTASNGIVTINCTTAGAVSLSANPGAGNTVNWYNVSSGGASLATGNTYSPSISATTIYYAESVGSNGCTSITRTQVEAKAISTNSWVGGSVSAPNDWFTAANWACGSVPNNETAVVIPSGNTVSIAYRPNQNGAAAYTVTLQGNASLTVTEDHNFTVTNKVTVASGATFTVENDASLVQTDDVTNEGSITVQKLTPSNRLLKRFDAVLWSSPVVQNLRAISTGTPDAYFMQHNPQANSWSAVSSPATADFTKGKGFLVRTPSTFPTTATQQWNVTFTGVPNNGNVTISAGNTGTSEKYLLVGNPYPSAISIAAFRAANPNITGVFYFFRKPNGVTGISSYGTLSANNSFSPNDDAVGAVTPGDVIPSGQGFFVAMNLNNNGEVYFTNAMRVANNHGTFNRMNTNLDTYRLLVQTPVGGNSQFITNYDAETTSGYDVGYDAIAFTDGTTDLSMIMNSKNYRIQSRGAYNAADVIPVQFKTATAGEHRIKLQDAQGVFAADQMVIIKDNLTGVQHNLTANGDYVFTATAGTFTNRFEVIYQQAYYTALQANSCGSTIANMNSLVYADLVNGATGYRFKVVNNTTSAVQTIDRPQHWFAFNMLSAFDYNTPYTISVQVQKDGVWTGYYGATCTVNSPNIAATGVMQINPSQCGATLATLGTVIATTPVAGATGYKFRITNTTANASGTNMVQEITRSNHWFTLAMLSRFNYGSSYTVEVAVKTTGAFTPYGNACTVYSPSAPTLASCGQTVATATTLVRTTAMTLATQYRFQVTRMSTQETITFDTANFWFSFRVNVPGYAAGEQYAVRVAVMTAGAWSPYGDACDITAPIATARTTEEASPSEAGLFKPVAYPNPFASTFGISLATPSADVVHVMVYDLQGRLIEKQNVFVSQLDSLQIGTNYPSGDYLLVVAQGANIKSSHIHKD